MSLRTKYLGIILIIKLKKSGRIKVNKEYLYIKEIHSYKYKERKKRRELKTHKKV